MHTRHIRNNAMHSLLKLKHKIIHSFLPQLGPDNLETITDDVV